MSGHTPEPWVADMDRIYSPDPKDDTWTSVVAEALGPPEIHRPNARRIVACVNACKGISTEKLEESPPGTLMDIISQLYSVCDSWERLRGFFRRESK
jgi:hypothetical protein